MYSKFITFELHALTNMLKHMLHNVLFDISFKVDTFLRICNFITNMQFQIYI